jgi:hypothetical protein
LQVTFICFWHAAAPRKDPLILNYIVYVLLLFHADTLLSTYLLDESSLLFSFNFFPLGGRKWKSDREKEMVS